MALAAVLGSPRLQVPLGETFWWGPPLEKRSSLRRFALFGRFALAQASNPVCLKVSGSFQVWFEGHVPLLASRGSFRLPSESASIGTP